MWNYFVSVYFMHNKDNDEKLDDNKFDIFLTKIIGFIWTYAVMNPGVNALRTPVYAEMVNIVNNKSVDFADFRFDSNKVKIAFDNYSFNNSRPITKSMLTWWALTNNNQKVPSIETIFEIEHIYSKNRSKLNNSKNLESLGNKSLLEKKINIRASDYRFSDKIEYYQGSKKKTKDGTQINELLEMSKKYNDFTEKNIEERNCQIIGRFISFLNENNLINEEKIQIEQSTNEIEGNSIEYSDESSEANSPIENLYYEVSNYIKSLGENIFDKKCKVYLSFKKNKGLD